MRNMINIGSISFVAWSRDHSAIKSKVTMSKRITQLDGVRALAISAVWLHHAVYLKLLWAGVDLFFILSGFLITGILIGSKTESLRTYFQEFYRRRARRILPPYILLLIVTSIVFGVSWAQHWYLYFFLMNSLYAFEIPQPHSLEILWSLAVEEQFYLVWPFAVFFLSERAIAYAAAAIIVSAPILRWVCTPFFTHFGPIYSLTPFRMDLLAMGALLAALWRKHEVTVAKIGPYCPILSAFAVGALIFLSRRSGFSTHANTQSTNLWIYELNLLACTGVIIWALSGRGNWMLNLAPVRYLGRISYSVYLIHMTALIVIGRLSIGKVVGPLIAATITLVYASVSWFYLEKPILEGRAEPASNLTGQSPTGC